MPSTADLIGTWRVIAFQEWSPDGVEHHPLGDAPTGYAIFDAAGRIFIQLSRGAGRGVASDAVARSFMAYFGTFSVAGDQLQVAIESGNNPGDVGTSQTRTVTVDGDVLTIGIPNQLQATLRREAKP
ncbi:lipocalin-like domain-containing protein [Dongia sedimenti]|uniref:Lipocalin-like domain-containing protein n=1 Tax=Dongia sedimenti TaxID=3064282 RepID=A0ABU0YQG9_9PROT|nr:lipocalin-like domain-containing protein [Rhodospirillaceae bacterium R-7]